MHNPTHKLPANDAGAETLRNYRYQHGYGVLLLVAATLRKQGHDYVAVWCEQEDDLLCEIGDDLFDAYQVKSQKPENGPWHTGKAGFISAIKVFLHLEEEFPDKVRWFNFVSNTDLFDTDQKKKIHTCPKKLVDAIQAAADIQSIAKPFGKALTALAKKAKTTEEKLFKVLKKLRFGKAPDRDALIAELVTNHLSELEHCRDASPAKLKRLAFDVLHLLEDAASLSSQAPERHYACLDAKGRNDPNLLKKRVAIEDLDKCVKETMQSGFRYISPLSGTDFARHNPNFTRFFKKMKRGGLGEYADTMRNQANSADAVLYELATRSAEGKAQVDHLQAMVKAECDLARLKASQNPEPYGKTMLNSVIDRLRDIATNDPGKACGQPEEVLFGTAGMLTEDCKVWWSEQFDVEEE